MDDTRPFDLSSSNTNAEIQGHVDALCIVARTYQKQYPYLLTFLLAISHNKVRPCVYLLITDTTSSVRSAKTITESANRIVGYTMAYILPIDYRHARNLSIDYDTDYGYAYTDAAIAYLLEKTTCAYFLFTNGDNLYTAGFIDDYILADMIQKIDIIAFNFVTRYISGPLPHLNDKSFDDGTRKVVQVKFEVAHIDLGAFVIRANFLRDNPNMRFVSITRELERDWSVADGLLIVQANEIASSRRIHRQILLIHQ